MSVQVPTSPSSLNFGGVPPGSSGPDISLDPSLPPTSISRAGGVQIAEAFADDTITARIDGDSVHFSVRDLSALEWVTEEVDPGELPPGHHGPPPKIKVLEVVAQSVGQEPLAVKKGQTVLVRVEYSAPAGDGVFSGNLVIHGSVWECPPVSLSFFLSSVVTEFAPNAAVLPRGTRIDVPITARVLSGPDTDVTYLQSRTQLDTGVTLLSIPPVRATRGGTPSILPLLTALNAPLGDNSLAIDQFAEKRTGFFLPVTVTADPQIQRGQQAIEAKATARSNVLGRPLSQIFALPDIIPDGLTQEFEHGQIYFSPGTDAWEVHDDIWKKYLLLGGPTGTLGLPVSDGDLLSDGVGVANHFQRGSIYSHPQIGPRMVRGAIRDAWSIDGAERSDLGYPVRDEERVRTVTPIHDPPDSDSTPRIWSMFQNGAIVQSTRGLGRAVPTTISADQLKQYVRKVFDDTIRQQDADTGLDPGVEIPSVLEWDYDLVQSSGRGVIFRLSGFHSNPLVQDTTFVLDLGLRLGWKVEDSASDGRILSAALIPGSLRVQAFGLGDSVLQRRLTDGITAALVRPFSIANLPVVVGPPVLNDTVWVVVDVFVASDGGLTFLTLPTPNDPFGAIIQAVFQQLVDKAFS